MLCRILSCQGGCVRAERRRVGRPVDRDQTILLLVEDNGDDELLTVRTLKKNNICNHVVVAGDGAEALDYLLGTGG